MRFNPLISGEATAALVEKHMAAPDPPKLPPRKGAVRARSARAPAAGATPVPPGRAERSARAEHFGEITDAVVAFMLRCADEATEYTVHLARVPQVRRQFTAFLKENSITNWRKAWTSFITATYPLQGATPPPAEEPVRSTPPAPVPVRRTTELLPFTAGASLEAWRLRHQMRLASK